jgi:2-polyprenyl-3-methyl-5-hydroxy-6-metoxy-1,4-benzoquinol methylase
VDLRPPLVDGAIHAAYAQERSEVAALVPAHAHRVLDVGCSVGLFGQLLQRRGHLVTGIELDPVLAQAARARLDRLIEADVEELARAGADIGQPYDCVVLADVLEHLRDPWSVVDWVATLLAERGSVVVSVPNVRHVGLFVNVLFRRRWPYHDVGIFDRTHLRWFAYHNVQELFDGTDLQVTATRRYQALSADPASRLARWANRVAPMFGELGTLQFLVRAERSPSRQLLPVKPR